MRPSSTWKGWELPTAWRLVPGFSARRWGRPLTGAIAVGIIMVSGDRADTTITEAEQDLILAQVIKATDFLVQCEPRAKLSFDYDIQPVNVATDPTKVGRSNDPYERLEAPCACGSKHGALKETNGNCVKCKTPRVTCLMETNDLALCPFSRRQLGWGSPYI